MGPVFEAAQAEIEPELVSWHDRNAWFLGRVGNWHFVPEGGSSPNFWGSIFDQIFDVAKERDETWVKATMIAAMAGSKNLTQAGAQGVLESGQPGRAFDVGGVASSDSWASTKVTDYDWLHQPTAAGFTSPLATPAEKIAQIDKLLKQWLVSDGDVREIEHILSTVQAPADMATIRAQIEPRLVDDLTDVRQRTRVRVALNRQAFP